MSRVVLINFILSKWKEKGTVKDEEETRNCIEAMLFLTSSYRLKCLINTLFEIDEYIDEFNQNYQEIDSSIQ